LILKETSLKPVSLRNQLVITVLLVLAMSLIYSFLTAPTAATKNYSDFQKDVTSGLVTGVEQNGTTLTVTLKDGSKYNSEFETAQTSEYATIQTWLTGASLKADSISYKVDPSSDSNLLPTLLFTVGPFLLIGAILFIFLRQAQRSNNQALGFGKSKARLSITPATKVTFADVAGVDEAKADLQEVVEFLKYPEKFESLGAKIPRGVLLVGGPGVGKTLMARAVAGEASVPFLSISGSEFVELFVGVGASRTRDLFDQAKRNSPSIIFIDELDAIGRHRGSGLGNSNDEREQTLNQILVEMDGFDTKSNVIVIAATNRPDILDPALLRPGRFDRQVMLDKPDVRGRLAILQVHVKGKPLDKDVNLETLAHLTIGFSGADLANLANEGAILAARNGHKVITQSDLTAALDRIAIGPERKSRLISDEEKRIIAIHEGGHALVQRMLPKCDPVSKVTILGRGMALGFTASLPAEDRYLQSRSEFRDKLAGLLAGNTAEQIVLGDTTTGASNDIEKATQIARAMVTKFGMSEKLGPVTFGRSESSIFLNREINEQRDYSDSLANQIDVEIKALIEEAQRRAHEVVTKYLDRLNALVDKLIVVETLEAEEFEKLFVGLPKDLTI
jgi:cell division protease FtsH